MLKIQLRTRIAAGKKLFNCCPIDPWAKAQLREIEADATIAEHQFEQLAAGNTYTSVYIYFDISKGGQQCKMS